MRYIVLLALVVSLSACGNRSGRSVTTNSNLPFAKGPIYSACLDADRKAASRALCGCVQAVANRHLSSRDQKKAAGFFKNPQLAQDARQNGSRSFWNTYKKFSNNAAQVCRGA